MANTTIHPSPASNLQSGDDSSQSYQYKPITYFSLTFVLTFAFWFVGAYASFQDEGSGIYFVLMLIGLMVPFLLSLVMIFTSKNPQLKRDFVNRLTNPKLIRVQMLPVLFLLMPLSVVLSILFSVPFGGSLAQFEFAEEFSFTSGFVPVLLLLILAACFEELGWRGYAFESLETRYTYFTASVIFSILWSLWHFPLIFVNGSYQYEVLQENIWYATNFFVSIIPMGIIVSWFCIKNRKSILAAVVFHFLINISQEMMNITQTTKCVQTFVLTAFVAIIVFMEKDLFFSREHLTGKKGYFTGKMTHG